MNWLFCLDVLMSEWGTCHGPECWISLSGHLKQVCRRDIPWQVTHLFGSGSDIIRLANVAVHARPTSRPIESECDERGTIVERLVVGRSMEPLVGPEIHSGCSVRLSEWGDLPHAVKSDLV